MRELKDALKTEVKIDHHEVLKVIINDLIEHREISTNNMKHSFDDVLKYYLGEEDFDKYVIRKEKID